MSLPHTRPDVPADDAASPAQAVCARAEVQRVRWVTGLSQDAFARSFAIDPDALRDVEAGRARPNAAFRAYLKVIARDPGGVSRAVASPG
jgi:DNA-binding transcriptional regulator YiaG